MANITSDRVSDPEAQAAVTDFLDYTEYLPSDLLRSLTLIRGLDDKYLTNSYAIHGHTKRYGSIPSLEPSMRPGVHSLRLQISSHLDQALNARESAYAEASRMFDVADRHQNRLKSIITKLKAIPKPPSRDPSPAPHSAHKRSRAGRKLENGMSATRLTLNPPRGNTVAAAILNRPRGRRVTVPGEVMPPYDPDEAIASTEVSDWESPPPSPPRPVLKLKQPKPPKERPEPAAEKPPRAPREHVSYRKPTPPPEDAEIGSKYKPWTHLTEYEMYKLRKKMKKNHEWEPSQVMIRRELETRGRGWDSYYKAKAEAEKNGTPFVDFDSSSQPKTEKPEPRPSQAPATPTVVATPDPVKPKPTVKKSEPKKDKKPDPARDRAALAAQEAELAARRLGDIGSAFKNLFSPLSNALASLNRSTSTPTANTSAAGKKTAKKRKLEELGVSASPSAEPETQKKKQKTTAPKPTPVATSEPPQQSAGTIKIPLKLNLNTQPSTSTETSTPASATRAASAAGSSVAPKTEESTPPPPARSVSRKSTMPPEEIHTPATAPITAPTTRASARTTPAATARQTPVIETSPKMMMPTAASRRPKREVPGTVMQSSQDGGAVVSVSQRKTKPVKTPKPPKTNAANSSPEIRVDVDGKAEVVDPDEERYCVCGDVSYGEMICCEMDEKVSPRPLFVWDPFTNTWIVRERTVVPYGMCRPCGNAWAYGQVVLPC